LPLNTYTHTHMERVAKTRNGTSNSLHIDVANCNLCYASHCKLKSCSMHFDKNRTDIIRLHIKEKQSQQPLPRIREILPYQGTRKQKGILISFLHKR
jgi:hypothetical protein